MSDGQLWGYKQIADALGCSPRTVLSKTKLARDPLRVRRHGGKVWADRERVEAWRKRHDRDGAAERVESWVDIAATVNASVRTVQRWAARERDPLPVEHREREVYAFRLALLDWIDAQERGAT